MRSRRLTRSSSSNEPVLLSRRAWQARIGRTKAGIKGSSPRREKPITKECKRDEASGSKLNAIWRKGRDARVCKHKAQTKYSRCIFSGKCKVLVIVVVVVVQLLVLLPIQQQQQQQYVISRCRHCHGALPCLCLQPIRRELPLLLL